MGVTSKQLNFKMFYFLW